MTIFFEQSLNQLNNRLYQLDHAFERALFSRDNVKAIDRYAMQEGLMSSLWQSWCFFCRDIFLGSVSGGVTLSNQNVTSPYAIHSHSELIYLAQQFSSNKLNISTIKSAPPHAELTWGDALKFNKFITPFNPSNLSNLLQSFGGVILLLDLQRFRNANAHVTSFTIGEVKNARVRYSETKFRHPSDTMYWVDPSTQDFLWKSWVEEIEIISLSLAS